jgi:uncharacterized protein (DUF983 family)
MAVEMIAHRETRPVMRAIGRGTACRCPRCGQGKLYRRYLKLADKCSHCGLDLTEARADDFPPYIAIFIVGHVLVGYMLHAEMSGPVDPMFYVWTMVPLSVVLPVILLPFIKGAVVGLQWAMGMHGFAAADHNSAVDP